MFTDEKTHESGPFFCTIDDGHLFTNERYKTLKAKYFFFILIIVFARQHYSIV